ncbi:mammalian cell entry protein [Mycobacterium sp. MS1601]|uniref:mammalian cell entry protein n=1 Tax=Mycobacterium sp. MS1601 TaxID=1936029 RepID=UPI0009794A16|nr:mammalian cell entry protein [Mycobacterium sp. MS1601]AQA03512.1 mammalian cell entry protein [Mycobacterium sp. MS1601]
MSPRKRVGAAEGFSERPPLRRRRIGLAVLVSSAVVVIVAALAASALLLVTHEEHRRAAVRDVAVIGYVRSFMTQYTSPDPMRANDYADGVLAQATGQLAQMYQERMNEIVVQVAQAEPTTGTVLDAGVERWNDDGSADVVVATKTVTTFPDGRTFEDGSRWVATAIEEGGQWKISNLLQVI